MPTALNQGPIHPNDSKYQPLLQNLQGNILQAHHGKHALHIFLKFKTEVVPTQARNWLRAFVTNDKWPITSAYAQFMDSGRTLFTTESGKGIFCNVFLSAKGYKALLGYEWDRLKTDFQDLEEWGRFQFLDGMAKHAHLLGDPDTALWEPAYRNRKIHVMVLMAHDNLEILKEQKVNIEKDVAGIADVLHVEYGHRLYRGENPVEPFGYVDGISQPHFFVTSHGDFAPLDLVLLPDPSVPKGEDCYGSYLVFWKLEQNVYKFQQQIQKLAEALKCDKAMAEALVMGRFKDGTPLALADKAGMPRIPTNNFNYHQDPNGTKCPFHAHIRRLNPRGESAVNLKSFEDDAEELRHRIVRRGISYGTKTVPSDPLPCRGVGTLFMCFQRSISNQFGFLQRTWANSTTKPGVQIPIGVDPIIGQRRPGQNNASQPRWPLKWGEQNFRDFDFDSCITPKGGEFLFAPSLPFFHSL